jgi:hypothetical protein
VGAFWVRLGLSALRFSLFDFLYISILSSWVDPFGTFLKFKSVRLCWGFVLFGGFGGLTGKAGSRDQKTTAARVRQQATATATTTATATATTEADPLRG